MKKEEAFAKRERNIHDKHVCPHHGGSAEHSHAEEHEAVEEVRLKSERASVRENNGCTPHSLCHSPRTWYAIRMETRSYMKEKNPKMRPTVKLKAAMRMILKTYVTMSSLEPLENSTSRKV